MILRSPIARAILLISLPLITAGCGGGNDADAGSLTQFNIVPTTLTLTSPGCAPAFIGRVYVYGGAGPYRVYNGGDANDPLNAVVRLSKTTVDRPGDFFEVSTVQPFCLTNVSVIVVDQLGRQVTLSVNSVDRPPT